MLVLAPPLRGLLVAVTSSKGGSAAPVCWRRKGALSRRGQPPALPPPLQLHIFIFVVALTHVVMGVGMVLLSSWRLHTWRQCCGDEDDQHAQQ